MRPGDATLSPSCPPVAVGSAEALIEEARRRRRRRWVLGSLLVLAAVAATALLVMGHGDGQGTGQSKHPGGPPQQVATTGARQEGTCFLSVSVTPSPTVVQANAYLHGALSYRFQCPGIANPIGSTETFPGTIKGITLVGGQGGEGLRQSGTWEYLSAVYLTGDTKVVDVRLVQQTTGQTVASVQPVWAPSLQGGVAPLIHLGADQQQLEVQALGASGVVIASAPWSVPNQPPTRPLPAAG